jgi:uncharacterized protein YeaO (DUF488 family)
MFTFLAWTFTFLAFAGSAKYLYERDTKKYHAFFCAYKKNLSVQIDRKNLAKLSKKKSKNKNLLIFVCLKGADVKLKTI